MYGPLKFIINTIYIRWISDSIGTGISIHQILKRTDKEGYRKFRIKTLTLMAVLVSILFLIASL